MTLTAELLTLLDEHERFQNAATKGKWAWQRFGKNYYLTGQYGNRPIILSLVARGLSNLLVDECLLVPLRPDHPDSVFIAEARTAWPATTRALRKTLKIIDSVVANPVLRDELMVEIREAYDG
jgi:hypothetical protein